MEQKKSLTIMKKKRLGRKTGGVENTGVVKRALHFQAVEFRYKVMLKAIKFGK